MSFVEGLTQSAPSTTGDRPGVKRALVGDGCRVVMFSFAPGQLLGEHSAAFPIIVQALSGRIEFRCEDRTVVLEPGNLVNLPARVQHEVRALTDAVMMLVMLDPDARPAS